MAGEGVSELPAWQDESVEHYCWRLAKHLGKQVGAEPKRATTPSRYRLSRISSGVRNPSESSVREPGEDG